MKIILLLLTFSSFANIEQVEDWVLEIGQLKPEDFPKKISEYRQKGLRYIDNKKKVCNGEFSTLILKDLEQKSQLLKEKDESGEVVAKTLSGKERKICLRELKSFHQDFMIQMHKARKKYFNYLHDNRLKELEESHLKSLKALDENYQKKNP